MTDYNPDHCAGTGRLRACIETLAAVAPAMAALFTGRPELAASLLYGVSAVVLTLHAIARRPDRFIAFAISIIPPVMLVRNQFHYTAPIVFFGIGLTLWWLVWPDDLDSLFSSGVRQGLVIGALVYWLASWLNTGVYSLNLHAIELVLTALAVFVLFGNRYWMVTALTGFAISVLAVAVGAFPYGDRLGLVELGYMSLGNPVSFGSSAALVFLLCLVEKGRWLGLEDHSLIRLALALVSTACLAMSTSRGSWLVTIGAVLASMLLDKEHRGQLIAFAVVVPVLAVLIALSTGRGGNVVKYYNKVADDDRTFNQKTTGRLNQWEELPNAFSESPIWGHGGGSGAGVYKELAGKELAWHSLYLQLLVETGLIGFCFMMALLLGAAAEAWRFWRYTMELLPLLALICYCVLGLSISAFDALSGLFLGLALSAGNELAWPPIGVAVSAPVLTGELSPSLGWATDRI